jgi:hypothetical protein
LTLPTWKTDCGCTQIIGCGQKRDRFCEHKRPYVKVVEGQEDAPKSRRRSSLKQGACFAASDAQRAKVAGMPCIACGVEATEDDSIVIDPAHLWPRSKGGCDHEDCVVPACRYPFKGGEGCHRLFDEGQLDLTERLADSEAWQVEQAHPILVHGVSPVELVRRLSGGAYEFVRAEAVAS